MMMKRLKLVQQNFVNIIVVYNVERNKEENNEEEKKNEHIDHLNIIIIHEIVQKDQVNIRVKQKFMVLDGKENILKKRKDIIGCKKKMKI